MTRWYFRCGTNICIIRRICRALVHQKDNFVQIFDIMCVLYAYGAHVLSQGGRRTMRMGEGIVPASACVPITIIGPHYRPITYLYD